MKNLFSIVLPMLLLVLTFNACKKDSSTAPDPCEKVTCYNGGVCKDGRCDCPPGYSGVQCQVADPCYNITCYNGGTCANGQCNCPTGYGGSDCSIVLTPVSMTIRRIEVTNYPITQSSGAGWDVSDGADAFVTFNSGTSANQNDFVSGRYTDVTGQDLVYTNGLPITISDLNINWVLAMWDYDATSNNDFMTGVYFKPISMVNGFPSSFEVHTANMSATLYVTWNF